MGKSKIAFIINPNSGTNRKKNLPALIEEIIDKDRFEITIVFTQYAGHGRELAAGFVAEQYQYIIACGGDGTVNEIASQLVHTDAVFGIVPCGSGNGLARHLKVPMSSKRALELINDHVISTVDYGLADETKFFCTCGLGFDAHISRQFAIQGTRGLVTYLKTILKEYRQYKPYTYTLKSEEFEIEERAFLVTFANASQYGNNAFIAPRASMSDGVLDVCVLKPFSFVVIPQLVFLLFRKKIEKSKYVSIVRAKEITLVRQHAGAFHADGDPLEKGEEIRIKIVPAGLKVLTKK
jgi:YegS/Rv2252/BmrU family lipid kinase